MTQKRTRTKTRQEPSARLQRDLAVAWPIYGWNPDEQRRTGDPRGVKVATFARRLLVTEKLRARQRTALAFLLSRRAFW